MFEAAKIGSAYLTDRGCEVAVYSVEKIIAILVEDCEMDGDEAWDHFGFNIECAWHGPGTPIFVHGIPPVLD